MLLGKMNNEALMSHTMNL